MLEAYDLEVRRGSFKVRVEGLRVDGVVVLLGRNGSGKSTILRCLAGFIKPVKGRIILDGQEITNTPPSMRKIGYMPQEPVKIPLNPSKTIEYFGERFGTDGADVVDKMGLADVLGKEAVSPGESQIINLAVLMMRKPRVLLLDEPAGNLDFLNKIRFWQVLKNLSIPMVYVTHDPIEASVVGETIYFLHEGLIKGPFPNTLKTKALDTIDVLNLYTWLEKTHNP